MRRSALKLYAPFIALALAQAAFVIASPSKGESNNPLSQLSANGAPLAGTAGGSQFSPTAGSATGASSSGAVVPGSTGGATSSGGGGGGTSAGVTGGGGGGGGTGGGGGGGDVAAAGDTSHCKNGQQTDIVYNGPPCAPKFTGDNGGATYAGVTDKEIKFFMMQCQPNEQVDAILATQGLAASDEEVDAMGNALVKFMNEHYEFYGRKLTWDRAHMDCPTSPPDPAKARQAGAEVAKKHPFIVYAAGGGSATADVLAQNGIVSDGVAWNGREFYAGRRPFRYDIFPNSTESADWMAEYYCKKLATGNATNAGALIHPTIGGRDSKRKLGIIVPDDGTGTILPAAQSVAAQVEKCAGYKPPIFTYQSDINRAQEQTRVTVAGLIDAKVTTVTCMCDPIAPVFLTNGMTQNNYYPEHFMAGLGLLDYDVLGRLYDPTQWNHAFGVSQLSEPIPFEQTDAAKVWKAAGNKGNPCAGCNLLTGYMLNIGAMIQLAGPNLNPLTIEQAMVGNAYHRGGWAETGGDPSVYLIKYGPDDYNAISDFREAYWDSTATSAIDGKQGAYISMNKGKRYAGGELDNSFTVPAKPS